MFVGVNLFYSNLQCFYMLILLSSSYSTSVAFSFHVPLSAFSFSKLFRYSRISANRRFFLNTWPRNRLTFEFANETLKRDYLSESSNVCRYLLW